MHPRPWPAQPTVIPMGLGKKAVTLCLGLLATVFRGWAWLRGKPPHGPVLILEPFGLGDILSFEPLIRTLLEAGREVRVCARVEWQPLFDKRVKWLPSAIPWGNHDSQTKYRLRDYFSRKFRTFLRDLKHLSRGAVGLDTRGDVRSVLLLYLAGCRRVVTLSCYLGMDLPVISTAAQRVPFVTDARRWQLNLQFLARIGVPVPADCRGPDLRQFAAARSKPGRKVALVPVGPWRGKWWNPQKWSALIGQLKEAGWDVSGLCGPGQIEILRQQIIEAVPLKECQSVTEWLEVLPPFDAVITLDSGPMHLADAMGIPMVALFGQGLLPLWAPSDPRSQVVTHQTDPDFKACQPTEANTPLGVAFMERITVEEVMEALRRTGAGG